MPRFTDKVAIITGSSNGIGRATALLFGKEGAKVTITGRNADSLKETRNQLLAAGVSKNDILEVVGDIISEVTQHKLVDETLLKFGKLDLLVNNAGGFPDNAGSQGLEQPMEHFDYTMNLNVKSIVGLTKYALPHLIKSQGEIVNVSSIAALPLATTFMPYYAMSKAALDNFTRAAAILYAKDGIRVNTVNPGLISTALFEKQGATKEIINDFETKTATRIPLKRTGKSFEIAETIAFLCDRKACGYITGQNIVVDGGATIVPHFFTTDDDEPVQLASAKKH